MIFESIGKVRLTTLNGVMQMLLAVAALALASLITAHYVSGANAPDLPKGVTANNWVPVSERLGLVMESIGYPGGGGDRQVLLAAQPIRGLYAQNLSGLAADCRG